VTTNSKSPKQLIRPEVRALSAYHVPDPGDCVKLDAMENPYHWPDALKKEWLTSLGDVEINRYPDPSAAELTQVLRNSMQVPDGMSLLLGNGSDELIQMLAMAVAQPDRVVLAPEPTFVMYRLIAEVTGMRYVGVPLRDDFSIDAQNMLQAIEEQQPALVFLAYPNNPTGNLFDDQTIVEVIEASSGLVVIDEAYAPFTDASFMQRLGEFNNLLVLRTVSKMGLAGLRLGLLAGPPDWLNEINKTRLPYNINSLTQASGLFALQHVDMLLQQAEKIRSDRAWLSEQLAALGALNVYPSEANFILFRTPAGQATGIFNRLREKGVLIKNLSPAGGQLVDCLRVTVGTAQENKLFMDSLSQILGR
jgi:histidinol-phosphate aminotransferase